MLGDKRSPTPWPVHTWPEEAGLLVTQIPGRGTHWKGKGAGEHCRATDVGHRGEVTVTRRQITKSAA